jgi:hypothetical protein
MGLCGEQKLIKIHHQVSRISKQQIEVLKSLR